MGPPGSTRRAAPLPPEQRRCAILDAVVPLLIERGDAVTTREMARAAGVAEGTLFSVFADKDELLAAAVEAAVDPSQLEAAIAAAGADDRGEAGLISVVEVLQHRSISMFRLMSTIGHRYRRGKPEPIPLSSALVAFFETTTLDLRLDPTGAAQTLRAITFSQSHPLLTAQPKSPEAIAELFLRGVTSQASQASRGEPTP